MASLTQVCMWRDKNWKRTTAEEAAKLYPDGTVSANSGLFMCELCGQYVLLTDTGLQTRHFRHSSAEKSKDCPERMNTGNYIFVSKTVEHELPIRIRIKSIDNFEIEVGFFRVPSSMLSPQLSIEIKPSANNLSSFVYNKNRLNMESITYLSVGSVPCENYQIFVSGGDERIRQFWPINISGINGNGTIFEASTGKKLPSDCDVVVGKKYYLLKRGALYSQSSHIMISEVCKRGISSTTWYVYKVEALDFDEKSARFFLDYHCRLTEKPVKLQPIWPVYTESPYTIKHNSKSVVLHIKGNATVHTLPDTAIQSFPAGKDAVVEVQCSDERQQLISAIRTKGIRTKALEYLYFWKEPLDQEVNTMKANVCDLKGVPVDEDMTSELPTGNILTVIIPYDGYFLKKRNGETIEKQKLKAETPIEIGNIRRGIDLEVYIGLDCVWKKQYIKSKTCSHKNEESILKQLRRNNGAEIKVPHTIGAMAAYLDDYPRVRHWLYQCIRQGWMNKNSLAILRAFVVKNKSTNGG